MHVAIIGLGMSARAYLLDASDWRKGRQFDEVWTLNRGGTIYRADRVFRMDDYHLMEAKGEGEQFINEELVKASYDGVRVYTSAQYTETGGWSAFPIQHFLEKFGDTYVNSSVPYMLGFAYMEGFDEVSLYGMDYSYNVTDLTGKGIAPTFAEEGRSCTEYWVGKLRGLGVKVNVPKTTTLMSACRPPTLYGYADGGKEAVGAWRRGKEELL